MKQVIVGYAMLALSILGIVSIATIAVVIVIEYRSADVIEQPVVEQPVDFIITCQDGLIHVNNVLVSGKVEIDSTNLNNQMYCIQGLNHPKVYGAIYIGK